MQNLRVEYWNEVKEVNPKDLIFIDETGMNTALTRSHARAPIGVRAYGYRPYRKGKNLTLIGAITLSGFLGGMTVDGGTDGSVFRTFVEKILVPRLWPGAVVVMDNLSSHQVKGVQEMIEATGAKVIYLAPYSPDFNPIENYWSKLKEYLRSWVSYNRDTIEQGISNAIDLISIKDIKNWFTHCCYFR